MHNIMNRCVLNFLRVDITIFLQKQPKNGYFTENEYSNLKFIEKQNTYISNASLLKQIGM